MTSRTVTVPITNDTLDEANETVLLQLRTPTGGATLGPQSTATLTILDNDVAGTVQFSQSLYTVTETAVSAPIAIVRTGGAASGVTVQFDTSNGPGASGALAGTDYTTTSPVVTFAASVASQTVTIPVLGNPAATGSRFVTLTLTAPGGGAVLGPRSTAQLKIVDDEAAVQFASPTYSVLEGGTIAITVERTGPATGTVIVPFTTGGGTAVAGMDYVATAGELTFAAATKTLTFPVRTLGNTAVEGSRTVGLTLGPGVTGTAGAALGSQSTATLTITDNDVGGQIQFSAATYTVSEATAVATITVVRTGGAAGSVTVDFATIGGGTATAGADYTAVTPTLTFAAGVMSRTVTVPITNDTLDEANETVLLQLTNATGGATLGPQSTATLTILDNDVGGVVQFSAVLYREDRVRGRALQRGADGDAHRRRRQRRDGRLHHGGRHGHGRRRLRHDERDPHVRRRPDESAHHGPAADRGGRAADQVVHGRPQQRHRRGDARRPDHRRGPHRRPHLGSGAGRGLLVELHGAEGAAGILGCLALSTSRVRLRTMMSMASAPRESRATSLGAAVTARDLGLVHLVDDGARHAHRQRHPEGRPQAETPVGAERAEPEAGRAARTR